MRSTLDRLGGGNESKNIELVRRQGGNMNKRIVLSSVLVVLVAVSMYAQATNVFDLVQSGSPKDVQAAISNGVDANFQDKDGFSLLMFAAGENQNLQVIMILLKAGANVNARASKGATPLLLAAASNPNPAVITALLKAGADIEARDAWNMTVLLHACASNPNAEVITVLLKAGADAKAKNIYGNTATEIVLWNEKLKNTDVLQQLQKALR